MIKRALQGLAVSGLLLVGSLVYAHGGGLNSCGCHFNRKTGECHCHRNRGCGCECEPDSCKAEKRKPKLDEKEQPKPEARK